MSSSNGKSGGSAGKDDRAARLAAALRANLRKRKGLGGDADPTRNRHPTPAADQD